jgi:probable rRNA maturation factor
MTGIETIIEVEAWRDALPDAEAFAAGVYDAARAREGRLAGRVALLLADDARLRTLNLQFRGKDAPTNVLSFPSPAGDGFLGDIALAYETCAREAREKGAPFAAHAAHLVAHGLLHLVGYDHERDDDALKMESLEIAILGLLGVANPYTEADACVEANPCIEDCATS